MDHLKLGAISFTGVPGIHCFHVLDRSGFLPYSLSSTQALAVVMIDRSNSWSLISSFLLLRTCVIVMAIQIILVCFSDQIDTLNIECQDEKYPETSWGFLWNCVLNFTSVFMCAFFPWEEDFINPQSSPWFPQMTLKGPENLSSLTKMTWKVNRRGGLRIQVSWPTIQGSWKKAAFTGNVWKSNNQTLARGRLKVVS